MPDILFENRGAVLIVTFNRPDNGNAFTGFMAKILHNKLKEVSEDRAIRAILLRGAGGNFINGHDINGYVGETTQVQDQIHQKIHYFYTSIREMLAMEKPIIGVVNGRVTGAGFSLMLACDLVMAGRQTIFNPSFTSYAMVPDGGATFLLPRKVGAARALQLLMLNDDFSAESAEKWGLVARMVDDEALEAQSLAWADQLAAKPTRALGATKRLITKAFDQDLNAQLSLEVNFWTAISKTFDFREAMKAYAAKHEPKFTGS